mmetsp:Transcript_18221/g.46663  ORF Transcript_18221/g.46663 Transcript_18221/m.46663 type:complete len:90 (-) Transcript_18221:415-684(-)
MQPRLWLLFLLSSVAVARRHRYGYAYNSYQSSRRSNERSGTYREPTLDDIEDDIIDAVTQQRDIKDWPPKWTRPVVAVSVLWYSSMFFT